MEQPIPELVLILLGALVGISIAWLVFRARQDAHRRETEREYELKIARFPADQQDRIRNLEMELAKVTTSTRSSSRWQYTQHRRTMRSCWSS